MTLLATLMFVTQATDLLDTASFPPRGSSAYTLGLLLNELMNLHSFQSLANIIK